MVNQTESILIPQVDYFFLGETVRQIFLKRESYFLGAQIKTAEVPFKTKDTSFTSVV